jgi:hypothetical protein
VRARLAVGEDDLLICLSIRLGYKVDRERWQGPGDCVMLICIESLHGWCKYIRRAARRCSSKRQRSTGKRCTPSKSSSRWIHFRHATIGYEVIATSTNGCTARLIHGLGLKGPRPASAASAASEAGDWGTGSGLGMRVGMSCKRPELCCS